MENSILGHLSFNYKAIVIDEIALEGLEGIGLPMLWKQIQNRISAPVTEKLKCRLWEHILKTESIQLYLIPVPVTDIEIFDRFDCIDENNGYMNDPEDYLDGPYKYCPVVNEYGSSQYYHKRTLLKKNQIKEVPYCKVEAEYGNNLVMVASIEERWQALAPHMPKTYLSLMTPPQYCILELVGRGRRNGQTSTGKTNLIKISSDPKLLFYNRKYLQDNDFIRVHTITQNICNKGGKSLLLRLKRFHELTLKSIPKRGFIRNIVDHLLTKPGFCDRTDEMIKKGLMTSKTTKNLQKKVNFFNFEDKIISKNEVSSSDKKKTKRKYISLSNHIDESSESENEEEETPVKCKYKIGVGLLRQAYELFLEAGLKGLTFDEIEKLLGIRFYTCRTICRVLKHNNLVREFLEDKGRQRKARYIAVAATRKMDIKYEEEKKKLLGFLDGGRNNLKRKYEMSIDDNEVTLEIKKKKGESKDPTQDNESNCNDSVSLNNANIDITEVKVIEGLKKTKVKSLVKTKDHLTLRQLRYTNGILKVLNDKMCVSGYTTLSNIVAKEINEPAMVAKSIKVLIQRLVSDNYIKIYNVKWPGDEPRFSKLICAPYVKRSDPVIMTKYKEIHLKSITRQQSNKKKSTPAPTIRNPFAQIIWPRYAKIQKLHEYLAKFAYFTPNKNTSSSFPEGFVLIADFIPSLTVHFVLSNINKTSVSNDILTKITEDLFPLKLAETPKEAYELLLKSNSFKNTIKENLKILAVLGLIQLVYYSSIPSSDYNNSSLFSFLVYVNRNAKILDTRGEWPRNEQVKNLEKSFVFNSFESIQNFWEEVFKISIHTTITITDRFKKKINPPVQLEHEVAEFDNGKRYGDGMGPCGFDSYFYMDVPWLWRSIYPKTVKIVRKKTLQQKLIKTKTEVKKVNKIVKNVPVKAPIVKEVFCKRIPKTRNFEYMKLSWSAVEDKIIMMCKAAITIMSPTAQVCCLRVRNIVARDLLSVLDPKKTVSACHRRSMFQENDSTMVHKTETIINYIRRNKKIMHKYDNLLRKLRLRHSTNMTRYINVARVAMLELVWSISQAIQSESYIQKVECIASSYEELTRNYLLTLSTTNKPHNAYKIVDQPTLKEAIIMTVMLSFNCLVSETMSRRIYATFKVYPETSLRTVLEQLRKCGALAAKEKNSNAAQGRHHLHNIVQSSYRIPFPYQRKWLCRLNNEFSDTLSALVDTGLSDNNIKGSPEINCFMCEMQAVGVLEIVSATVPAIIGECGTNVLQEENLNVFDIETKFKFKSGTLGWKNKINFNQFSDVFKNIKSKCEDTLQTLSKSYILGDKKNNKVNDKIISHLIAKGESGSTFKELMDKCGYKSDDLKEKLTNLESKNIIKRVGHYENIVVHIEFAYSWSLNVGEKYIVPTPWLNFDGELNLDILFKWAGLIMNKVFECPGCSVTYLTDVCELLNSRCVQDICTILEQNKCVTLKGLPKQEIDLFSDDEVDVEFVDHNEYASFDEMFVFPSKDALTRYSYLKKKICVTQL